MPEHPLFERLWNGSAQMEEWTAAVSQGGVTPVADNIITVHTTYFCGSVTAIRTRDGLVLVDTANQATAEKVLALIRTWDEPIHTVIYTHGHIDHTGGMPPSTGRRRRKGWRARGSSLTATWRGG